MKQLTRTAVLDIASGLRIAAAQMGREAKSARDLGFVDLAAACTSKAAKYSTLAELIGRSLTGNPQATRQRQVSKP